MDFFQAQDHARQSTFRLVLIFFAGVLGTIGLVYLVFLVAWFLFLGWAGADSSATDTDVLALTFEIASREGLIHIPLLITTAVGVALLVALGTLYRVISLSSDSGRKVAESMQGVLLHPDTQDADERRLLNVVNEMAIAAGAPMPDVYLLPDEHINAFAAGTTTHNAVIGVTRGAMLQLNRDQLQGVMAHEFSHIMNGDMRLNIRLVGVLYGIGLLTYIGCIMVRSMFIASAGRGRRGGGGKAAMAMLFVGGGMIVAGAVGTFFGSWIRAGISRQREFLADASAVQYTRYPQGIAGALERLLPAAGQKRRTVRAAAGNSASNPLEGASGFGVEYGHMLFSSPGVSAWTSPFATHPPLKERIGRIMPGWSEDNPIDTGKTQPEPAGPEPRPQPSAATAFTGAAGATAAVATGGAAAVAAVAAVASRIGTVSAASLEQARTLVQSIPEELKAAGENPYSARALAYALLLDKSDEPVRNRQLVRIQTHGDVGVFNQTQKLISLVGDLKPEARLPLIQSALPALRLLSDAQYRLFMSNMDALIAMDSRVELFEWCLQAVITQGLQEHFGQKPRTAGFNTKGAMSYALSVLARTSDEDPRQAFAAAAGTVSVQLTYSEEKFEPQRLLSAMQLLATRPPKHRALFVRAVLACVQSDGEIAADEASLLRAYFMLLDCPLPLALSD